MQIFGYRQLIIKIIHLPSITGATQQQLGDMYHLNLLTKFSFSPTNHFQYLNIYFLTS